MAIIEASEDGENWIPLGKIEKDRPLTWQDSVRIYRINGMIARLDERSEKVCRGSIDGFDVFPSKIWVSTKISRLTKGQIRKLKRIKRLAMKIDKLQEINYMRLTNEHRPMHSNSKNIPNRTN